MDGFNDVVTRLTAQYGHYLSLLEQAGEAIADRDIEALIRLEGDCAGMLSNLKVNWSAFEAHLEGEAEPDPRAIPAVHRMRDLIQRTRDQATVNEGALAQWIGEVGGRLRGVHRWSRAIGGYAHGLAGRKSRFTLDA